MTKRVQLCDGCEQPLGAARLVVNDPNGVSGVFHVKDCYATALGAGKAVSSARLHSDVETV